MDDVFSIQEAAERCGVSAHTLRYYERIGLLARVERTLGGHRAYTQRDVSRVRFLTMLRRTGMSIAQMQAFVRLEGLGEASFGARFELLRQHREQLTARMAELQHHLRYLDEKVRYYQALEERERVKRAASDAHSTPVDSGGGDLPVPKIPHA